MQELRLVGIADDGDHLLLTDGGGERFTLALTDDLRSAVRRDRRVVTDGPGRPASDSVLRPRDVQGLIRGGVPLEEIAERAGWTLEKVQRYEGPIRAERDYVSGRAKAVVLPSRQERVTLEERASARLADRGVEAERVVWDSWKTDDVHWTVVVRFPAGGRLREATWLFDPVNHSLRTVDDEARWLGGDELASATEEAPEAAAKSVSTQRKRAGERDVSVYDVEAEGGVTEAQSPHLGSALSGAETPDALTASMRARQASRSRAQRGRPAPTRATALPQQDTATQVEPVESLDVGSTPPPAPSHPRPEDLHGGDEPKGTKSTRGRKKASAPKKQAEPEAPEIETEDAEPEEASSARRTSRRSRGSSGTRQSLRGALTNGDDEEDDSGLFDDLPGFHEGGDDGLDEDASADVETSGVSDEAPTDETATRDVPERPSKSRSTRPSVPSWDDIMFGGRNTKN